MNYFAHAVPFLADPYFSAATGVPDWLTVADRNCRIRLKRAEPFTQDKDPLTASVARGVVQHIRDDARFHETRAFVELSLQLSARFREHLDGESGYRPAVLGHLVVELLLDAGLIAEAPERLEAYYQTLESVDPAVIQGAVNRMATQPTQRLAVMITEFRRRRILSDYLQDAKLLVRLNQVMCRVGLAELPDRFLEILPEVRGRVDDRREELLQGIPVRED